MPAIASTLRSTARRVPDAPALVFGQQRLSYRDLDAQVDRTAHALARLGLAGGDRFALMATNSDAFVIALYAALRIGAIFVPINPASAPPGCAICCTTPARAYSLTMRPPPRRSRRHAPRDCRRPPSTCSACPSWPIWRPELKPAPASYLTPSLSPMTR